MCDVVFYNDRQRAWAKSWWAIRTSSLSTATKVDKKHQSLLTYKRPLDFSPCYNQWYCPTIQCLRYSTVLFPV